MSAAALAFAVVMLLASSTVHVFAATVNMNMNDWNTFQQLLKGTNVFLVDFGFSCVNEKKKKKKKNLSK
jgi:hypothetical protein